MKKLNIMQSAFTILVFTVVVASSGHAVAMPNSVKTMDQAVLANVINSNKNSSSSNTDVSSGGRMSNLFLVFGGSLVGLSLVTRRLSV